MHINGRIVGSIAGAGSLGEVKERNTGSQQAVPSTPAHDSVVISEAGRALSAQQSSPVADLDPQQEAAIRQRIVDGAYDSLEIVDQVARRILESGDL